MKKIKFIISLMIILIVFLLNFNLIAAAEETTSTTTSAPVEKEVVDVGILLGFEAGEIFGSGISTTSLGDCNQRISFAEDDANLKLGDNSFSNIGPLYEEVDGGEPVKQNSYIDIDCSGNILQADFMTNNKGGIYSLNGNSIIVKGNSRVTYDTDKDGVRNIKLEDSEIKLTNNYFNRIHIEGKNINFIKGEDQYHTGYTLEEGFLDYRGREGFFLDPVKSNGAPSTINGVVIDPSYGSKEKIKLFFGSQEINENRYINFDEDKFVISNEITNTESFTTKFTSKNPYFRIESKDELTITTAPSSKITITNRYNEDKIPLVECYSYNTIPTRASAVAIGEGALYEINNGNLKVNAYNVEGEYNVFFKKDAYASKDLTSTPMEIKSFEKNKDTGLSGSRIVIDNYNKFTVTDKADLPLEQTRIAYNYPNEINMEAILGTDIEFDENILEIRRKALLSDLKEYYVDLTPETIQSIDKIVFSKDIGEGYFGSRAYAEGGVSVYKTVPDAVSGILSPFNKATFIHESAHNRHFYVDYSFDDRWVTNEADIIDNYMMHDGGGYAYKGEINTLGLFGLKTPKYGYACPYGATDMMEDVATFTEAIIVQPNKLKGVLLESNQYSSTYKRKIDLLYEYKFITREQYQNALKIGMSQ